MSRQIGIDPATGMLTLDGQTLSRYDPRLYGSEGSQQHDFIQGQSRGEGVDDPNQEASAGWAEMQRLYPGMRQLGEAGVGGAEQGQGYNEIQASAVPNATYDERFGFMVRPEDVRGPDPDKDKQMNRARMAIMAAMAAGGGLSMMGEGLGGTTALGEGLGGAAGEAGATGGMGIGSSGGGSFLGNLGEQFTNSLSDAGSWAQRGISNLGSSLTGSGSSGGNSMSWLTDLFGGGGPEQLSGPGMSSGSGGGSFLSDLFGGGSNSGGGSSSILGNLFGGGGSSGGYGSDILRLLGAAGGTALNASQARDLLRATQDFQREQMANTQLYGRPNTTGPTGSTNWTQDPTTHQWTQATTLDPHDQERLDQYRGIAGNRMTNAAGMKLPENVDFQANVNRYLPQSLGGSYVGTDPWGRR